MRNHDLCLLKMSLVIALVLLCSCLGKQYRIPEDLPPVNAKPIDIMGDTHGEGFRITNLNSFPVMIALFKSDKKSATAFSPENRATHERNGPILASGESVLLQLDQVESHDKLSLIIWEYIEAGNDGLSDYRYKESLDPSAVVNTDGAHGSFIRIEKVGSGDRQ